MKVIITDGDRREYAPPIIPSRCGTPCYMEIVKPPDKLVYSNGEAIDITGMEVVAYACDGREWGEVPNEWLTIDPDTVVASDMWTDGNGVNAMLITTITTVVHQNGWACGSRNFDLPIHDGVLWYDPDKNRTIGSNIESTFFVTVYNNYLYFRKSVDPAPSDIFMLGYNNNCDIWDSERSMSCPFSNTFYAPVLPSISNPIIPVSTSDPRNAGELYPESSGDIITVSWEYDEENIFTDTFQITIE